MLLILQLFDTEFMDILQLTFHLDMESFQLQSISVKGKSLLNF